MAESTERDVKRETRGFERSQKAKTKGSASRQEGPCGDIEGHFKRRPCIWGSLCPGAERAQAGLVGGGVLQRRGQRRASRGPE